MVKQLSAHELPLGKVFSSDFDFAIPNYQRPYSWESQQALQLLDDLTEALDRAEDEPYFLGSLVLVKADDDASAEVIDGQQRLTTLSLLLALLRHLTTPEQTKLRTSFTDLITESGDELSGRPERHRLRLRERDAEFFATYVQAETGIAALLGLPASSLRTRSQELLRDNVIALHKVLEPWAPERRRSLGVLLTTRTFLVVVTTPDLRSAHRIFSVMNSRGLDLSPTDIFKSEVVAATGDQSEAYAAKWEDTEELVGRQRFAELFAHIRMTFAFTRPKEELLREFPVQVLAKYPGARASKFVDEVLVPYARAYATLKNANFRSDTGAEAVNAWLRRLNRLDNNDWEPVAMWALHHLADRPAVLEGVLRRLEALAASMLIRRTYATPRGTRYGQVLRELVDGAAEGAPSLKLTQQEQVDTLRGLDGNIYNASAVRKYVLMRLDELVASAAVAYDHRIVTVEHVLPQHPRDDSKWSAEFTEQDRLIWTNRLANLVLLDRAKNSQAQNFEFDRKKRMYFTSANGVSPFALTTQVLQERAWTPTVLLTRQRSSIDRFAAAWGYDLGYDDLERIQPAKADSNDVPGARVTIQELLDDGLLAAGQVLHWERPIAGQRYECTVIATGQLQLPDGRTFGSPSPAACAAANLASYNGWRAWRRPDERLLEELWGLALQARAGVPAT